MMAEVRGAIADVLDHRSLAAMRDLAHPKPKARAKSQAAPAAAKTRAAPKPRASAKAS